MKSFSDINAGVIGVGFIGVAHVEALRRVGINVIGVAGSSPERAQKKAREANLPAVYDSADRLIADPAIDVIHIATPNNLHYEQVLACLAAGKHVVCEKPLTLTSDQSADLVERAAASDLVNAVCFNLRFYGQVLQSRAMVAEGDLGTVNYVTGRYFQDWLLRDTDWNWRLKPEEAGALRAVSDIGSHWLDLVRFMTGQNVAEVMAELHTFVPVRRHPVGPVETFASTSDDDGLIEEVMTSDDAASIMLRFEDGTRGLAAISQVSAGRKNTIDFEIDGSDASVSWRSEDPELLFVGHRGRPNELLNRDPTLVHESVAPHIGYPGGHVEGYADTFRALFASIYRDVAEGKPSSDPNYPTFSDGYDAMLVAEAVARSAHEQRWIAVDRQEET